jgi:hypothetical protein
VVKARTYQVPEALVASIGSSRIEIDDLERLRFHNDATGMWSRRVLRSDNRLVLNALLDREGGSMPLGVLAGGVGEETVIALIDDELGEFTAAGWTEPVMALESGSSLKPLSPEDVAFVARAFGEGASAVIFKPYQPLAWLTAAGKKPTTTAEMPVAVPNVDPTGSVPEGAIVLAIVDETDREAVLDLVAIAPGPFVFRRHGGHWEEDPGLLPVLSSTKPPPIVELDPEKVAMVLQQIDEATKSDPWEPTKIRGKEPIKASAAAIAAESVLLAGATQRAKAAAHDFTGTMPADLKKYWTVGRGAAKIRWGTPGSMRRCHRQLMKYVGPHRAWGTCNNLGKLLGGKGVAWDVGG